MKILLVLFVGNLCLLSGVLSQGYLHSHDLNPHGAFRRQLTATQQSQILSDVQQHQQHRFNLHHQVPPQPISQKQFLIQQQPGIDISSLQQQNIHNQRPPLPNQIRFPPNNVRNNGLPPPPSSSQILQHHTQTNFIPNFSHQPNTQFQRSTQNQLQTPQQSFQQQQQLQNPPSIPQANVKDEHFHAQNFVDLKNHYSQQSQHQFQSQPQQPQPQFQSQPQQLQAQYQSQSQQQPQNVPNQNQNFVQPQQNFVQPQFSAPPQSQFSPSQQPQNPTINQNQNFVQPQQQFPIQNQQVPNYQPAPQFQSQQKPPFPGPVNFQSFSQNQNQQFQNPTQFQTLPQFQINPQFQIKSQFQTSPQLPPQRPLVDPSNFQTAPQIAGAVPITPDQEAKQRLVQKHEAFVQKQYEKQQNKVKQLHNEFLLKQQALKEFAVNQRPLYDQTTPTTRSRPLLPSEAHLFQHAVKKYNEQHPTTTTTTTTTSEKTTVKAQTGVDPLDLILQAQRKDIYGQLKLETEKAKASKTKLKPSKPLGRDELLKQLRLALADNPPPSLGNKTFDSTDVVLPNGQKVQVIRTSDPNVISGKRQAPGNLLSVSPLNSNSRKNENTALKVGESNKSDFPDKLKHIAPDRSRDLFLPNGQKVEIVRAPAPNSNSKGSNLPSGLPTDIASLYSQSLGSEAQIISTDGDGPPSIEELARRGLIPEGYEIAGIPSSKTSATSQSRQTSAPVKKKPTFVYLEEQSDGSFKIQGVKTSPDGETKTTGSEVENILDRIRKGEIKLPPSVKKVQLPSDTKSSQSSQASLSTPRPPFPTISSTQNIRVTFPSSTVSPYSTLTPLINRGSTRSSYQASASNTHETTSSLDDNANRKISHSPLPSSPQTSPSLSASSLSSSTTYPPITEKLVATTSNDQEGNKQPDLISILKSNGLFAMAKYLKQSGLDSILNETGPYTIFAPTDKAFKNLLIQLGGPERAEDKFKANPRLLSGLLLHHVIPGSFEISSLQDEMTGVSLAGTQLRVNQYTMHDQEWNDVLITTINGAMVVSDKQDIKVPQGIAHGVDRVMFPLPVGDILQTLQSDRENRFSNFLKILYTAEMSDVLQNKGTKTYTVFAPTDKAFALIDPAELDKLISDKDYAQAFTMRHITPQTLFSAGMRFYQVKDSLQPTKTITIQKTSSGKIKVNESQMITSNIPATNGVIHALDGLL